MISRITKLCAMVTSHALGINGSMAIPLSMAQGSWFANPMCCFKGFKGKVLGNRIVLTCFDRDMRGILLHSLDKEHVFGLKQYTSYTSRNPPQKNPPKNSNVPSRTVLWISMDDVSSRIFCPGRPGRPGAGLQGSPGIAPWECRPPASLASSSLAGPNSTTNRSESVGKMVQLPGNYGQSWE